MVPFCILCKQYIDVAPDAQVLQRAVLSVAETFTTGSHPFEVPASRIQVIVAAAVSALLCCSHQLNVPASKQHMKHWDCCGD
jgi:hypothetical protein